MNTTSSSLTPRPNRFRFARFFLGSSMLIMGACGIIYEYTLGVLGNYLIGSSHEQIFVIIGIMMFAMGLGAVVQRRFVGRLFDKFLTIELLLGFLGGISSITIYAAFAWTASYHTVLYLFALAIGFFIGFEIPVLIRLNTEYEKSLRINLSEILCMDYVGALLGALLFTYVLLTRLTVGRISLVLGLVNTLLAVGGLLYFWPLVKRRKLLAIACTLSICVLSVGLARVDEWMIELEQRFYFDPIIHSETSKYQHIVMTQRDEVLKLYLNGRLQFSSADEVIYHDLLVHVPMTLAPRRDRVLILGGGDGLALREVLRYPDVRHVTLVDIDPAIVRLASKHPEMIRVNEAAFHDARVRVLEPDGVLATDETVSILAKTKLASELVDDTEYPLAEVSVYNIDADLFVQRVRETFDVAILDFPDPSIVELAKLYSTNFYRALADRLAPGALISTQSSSPFDAKRAFLCIGQTLRAAGYRAVPYRQNVPSFGEWGWHLAWRDWISVPQMRQRIFAQNRFSVETAYLTPEVMHAAFAFGKGWLESAQEVQPNSKFRPVLLQYYQRDRE